MLVFPCREKLDAFSLPLADYYYSIRTDEVELFIVPPSSVPGAVECSSHLVHSSVVAEPLEGCTHEASQGDRKGRPGQKMNYAL